MSNRTEIYLLFERTPEWTDVLMAYEDRNQADLTAEKLNREVAEEYATVEELRTLFDNFAVDHPEPRLKKVYRQDCKDAEDYEFKNSFYEPVYKSIHEQERHEWLLMWRMVFENHLKQLGLAPLKLSEAYWTHDHRIFGIHDTDFKEYFVTTTNLRRKKEATP